MSFFKRLFSRSSDRSEPAEAPPLPALFADDVPSPAPADQEPPPGIREPSDEAQGPTWVLRLREGLSKSSRSLTGSISSIFTKR
jgi:hypothetical protein